MNREAAIEAAVKAIEALRFTATAEDFATAAIDAAAPHLVGEPVGYAVVDAAGEWISTGQRVWHARDARRVVSRLDEDGEEGHRVVALVPLEDLPARWGGPTTEGPPQGGVESDHKRGSGEREAWTRKQAPAGGGSRSTH